MPLHHAVEVVVAMVREEFARELDRTETPCAELAPEAAEFVLDKPVIEPGIVRNEDRAVEDREEIARDRMKHRRMLEVFRRDAGELLDFVRHKPVGVHQRLKFLHDSPLLHTDHRHINDATVHRVAARRFDVNNGQRSVIEKAETRFGCYRLSHVWLRLWKVVD